MKNLIGPVDPRDNGPTTPSLSGSGVVDLESNELEEVGDSSLSPFLSFAVDAVVVSDTNTFGFNTQRPTNIEYQENHGEVVVNVIGEERGCRAL